MPFVFEGLLVYRNALDFAVTVINVIEKIDAPRKHYKLIEQLEACCTSVALNIAEGKGRLTNREFKYFLHVARGSLFETVTMLKIFEKKKWIDQETCGNLWAEAEKINKMLSSLIRSIA